MNQRSRDRVAATIRGEGIVIETGEPFLFEAQDFSVMGMKIFLDTVAPPVGAKLDLNFAVEDSSFKAGSMRLTAEVMRAMEDGYGVRWLVEEGSDTVEVLENYYIERFFDAMD